MHTSADLMLPYLKWMHSQMKLNASASPSPVPPLKKRREASQKVRPIVQGVAVHRGLSPLAYSLQKVAERIAVSKAKEHQVFLDRMERVSPEGNAHDSGLPRLFGGG